MLKGCGLADGSEGARKRRLKNRRVRHSTSAEHTYAFQSEGVNLYPAPVALKSATNLRCFALNCS